MKTSKNRAIEVIVLTIQNDQEGIKSLLKRNGVKTDNLRTNKDLSRAFITALSKSRSLAEDYAAYLKSLENEMLSVEGVGEGLFSPNKLPDLTIDEMLTKDITVLPDARKDSFSSSLSDYQIGGTNSPNYVDTKRSFLDTLTQYTDKAKDLADLYKDIVKTDVEAELAITQAQEMQKEESNETKNLIVYGTLGVMAIGLIIGIVYYAKKK